jgi:hypothetical protein
MESSAMRHSFDLRLIHSARSGVATLEFVMALPFLLLLMVAITWLGYSVIGQTEVLVQSRNKAWEKRFNNTANNPLCFPILPEHDLPLLPKYVKSADYVTEKASQRVNVSALFSRLPGPEASHTILAGSWDHQAMKFNEPPDFELMAKAAVFGTFANVLDLVSSARDPLGLLKKLADVRGRGQQIQTTADQDAAKAEKGESSEPDSGSDAGTGGQGGGEMTAEQAKAKSEADLEEHKKKLKERFKELGGRIDSSLETVWPYSGKLEEANDAVTKAQEESKKKYDDARYEQDEEKKKLLQEEAARADRKTQLARITYERLKLECLDIAKEADALDIGWWELNALLGIGIFP